MRIVIINDMLWGGGRERRIVQLISGLNDAGYNDIHLILLDERIDYEEVYKLNVTITKIIRSSNKDFSVFRKLYAILKNLKPDVINTWSFMSTLYAAPIAKLLRINCVGSFIVDCNNPKLFSLNFFAKHIGFLLCTKIVSNSYAGHLSYKTPRNKRVVIYNGFDKKRHNNVKPKSVILNELNLSPTTKIVAMAARFDKQKDFNTFIEACQILRQKRTDFVALCIGQGDLLSQTQERVTKESDPYILFTGFRSDIESLIQISHVGVLCTNPNFHKEGVSNSILEFMAFSKPVLATSGGGTNEIIIDNQNGFLIEPFDSINLANKINLLFDDNQLYDRLSISALETVATKFALNKMTNDFIELYKNDNQWK
jgi:glycosyltransferase involved in cell wall biosynthesis